MQPWCSQNENTMPSISRAALHRCHAHSKATDALITSHKNRIQYIQKLLTIISSPFQ